MRVPSETLLRVDHKHNGFQRTGESHFVGESRALLDQERPHISVVIPRGEVVRNFIYPGALDALRQDAELSLITVRPGAEFDEIFKRVADNVFPLNSHREKWLVRIQRDILELAHGRWLDSRASRERWRQRDLDAKSLTQKFIRRTKKMVSFPFANRPGLAMLNKLERSTSRVLKTTNEYVELFRRTKPQLVFNGSHVHSTIATQAIQAANWLGIPTATFLFSWDNLTSQGRITLPYDYFLVWNEALRNQLLEMYHWINPENVFVTGTPQFDFHFRDEFYVSREEFFKQIGADPERPLVLYSTGMANHMPGEPEIVEHIADVLSQLDLPNKPQLLVRVYAKDLTGRFDELKSRRKDIFFPEVAWASSWLTPKYEDSYDLVNILRHCDLGINVASTVSLELCMFDKPVINIGYNPSSVPTDVVSYADYYEFDHYRPVVASGAVQVAWNSDEITTLIRSCLQDPLARSNERTRLIRSMFGKTLDGHSADRVAKTLLDIAGSCGNRN